MSVDYKNKIKHMQEGANPHFLFLSGLNIHRLCLNNKAEKSTRVFVWVSGQNKKTSPFRSPKLLGSN